MTTTGTTESPRIRLGLAATEIAALEANGGKIEKEHLEAAILKLQARAEAAQTTHADSPAHPADRFDLDPIKKSIERLSIEIAHFRFMLLACLCPDEEALQKELEKVHDRMNEETREMLIQYGIPTKDRDADMATFYRMQEAMRGEQEPDMEEER